MVLNPGSSSRPTAHAQRRRPISSTAYAAKLSKSTRTTVSAFQRYQRGDKRPAFDALCQDAAKRQFEMLMAWSVDRLGRRLQDLVGFLSELQALRIAGHHPTHCEATATAQPGQLGPVLIYFRRHILSILDGTFCEPEMYKWTGHPDSRMATLNQAHWRRRRHQPRRRRPPHAVIRPGSDAPATGPGTGTPTGSSWVRSSPPGFCVVWMLK